MNGDEQIGIVLGGEKGTVPEGHELILLPCEEHFHLRVLFADLFGQFPGNRQRQVLFLGAFVLAYAAGVLASVSGVQDYGVESQVGGVLRRSCNIYCNCCKK